MKFFNGTVMTYVIGIFSLLALISGAITGEASSLIAGIVTSVCLYDRIFLNSKDEGQ